MNRPQGCISRYIRNAEAHYGAYHDRVVTSVTADTHLGGLEWCGGKGLPCLGAS